MYRREADRSVHTNADLLCLSKRLLIQLRAYSGYSDTGCFSDNISPYNVMHDCESTSPILKSTKKAKRVILRTNRPVRSRPAIEPMAHISV